MTRSTRISVDEIQRARYIIGELVAAKLQVSEQDAVLVKELAELCDAERVIMLCFETQAGKIVPLRHMAHGFDDKSEEQRWHHFMANQSLSNDEVIAAAASIKADCFASRVTDYIDRKVYERSTAMAHDRGLARTHDLMGCGWRHSRTSSRMTAVALHRLRKNKFGEIPVRRLTAFAEEWKLAAQNGELGPTHSNSAPSVCVRLTDSEVFIVERILRGWSMQRIGDDLGNRQVNTINHHATAIYRKFGVKTRAELQAIFIDPRMHMASISDAE